MRSFQNKEDMVVQTTKADEYPAWGICIVVVLILLAPFVNKYLVYAAFGICVLRMIRYDILVFGTDYCLLAVLSLPFCTPGGVSLLAVLCVLAVVWYFIRSQFEVNASLLLLLILMDYLLLRMEGEISQFVLCFSQLLLLRILLERQEDRVVIRTSKLFCVGIIISSLYALILRGTPQMIALRGNEVPAYWGSTAMRFQGLFQDPNYYMALLVVAIVLMIKLRGNGNLGKGFFFIGTGCLFFLGILTYSKTFLVVFSAVFVIYVFMQVRKGNYFGGVCLMALAGICILMSVFVESSPFAIILHRLTSNSGISDLTTGRSEIYVRYLKVITENIVSLLAGGGLGAEVLGMNTHNLFLEITYYTGLIGLVLFLLYMFSLVYLMKERATDETKGGFLFRYIVLLAVAALFFTLHGMFSANTYVMIFLAVTSTVIPYKGKEAY